MFVKKFEAPSIDEALTQIKADMGPDALILSTQQRKKNWFARPMFEVTAAFSQKEESKSEASVGEEELERIFPHRRQTRYADSQGSLRHTDYERYQEMLPEPAVGRISKPYLERFQKLGFSEELSKDFNNRLVTDYQRTDLQNRAFFDKVSKRILSERLRTLRPDVLETRQSWVLLGLSGSGKTSSAVKLAVHLKKMNKLTSLASLDRRKVLGATELATYARLMGCPFDVEPARKRRQGSIQFVDTPCLASDISIESAFEKCHNPGVILVIDSTTRLEQMTDSVRRAEKWGPSGILFSKVDLCRNKGAMLELVRNESLPVFGVSLSGSYQIPFRFVQPIEFATLILKMRGES